MGTILHQPGIVTTQNAPYAFSRSKSAYRGPDPSRVKEQLEWLQDQWKRDGAREFMYRFCWIQPKPPEKGERKVRPTNTKLWNRNLIPFLENRIQTDIERKLGPRNIFLKPRQGGYSTYAIIRRLFLPCILNPGHNGLLIAQKGKSTSDFFRILRRCHNTFGMKDPFDSSKNTYSRELRQHLLHTVYSNRRELVYDQIDVSIHCESAEVEESGQGYTAAHVVADEVARWERNPEATLANLKEAIPSGGTLDIVSTANGWGGYFFEECMRARDKNNLYKEFTYHFHPWWFHDEYFEDQGVEKESLEKDEHRLIMTYGLTRKQIAWRRRKKTELRHEFDEKYPEDDLTCFLLSGQQYFDKDVLKERHVELQTYEPKEKYKKLKVFKREKPHREYIIGADVASGLDVSEGKGDLDYSTAHVLDKETGEQVAEYKAHVVPEEFGMQLAELGRRYNNALIAVEKNEDGGQVILTLTNACMYMNIYKHRDWWKRDWKRGYRGGKGSSTHQDNRMREIEGFPTNLKTRPLALNRLKFYIEECPENIHSLALIEECLTFVRNQDHKGRPEASPGCHDDLVLAGAIAHYVRQVVLGYLVPEALPRKEKYGAVPQEFEAEEQDESTTPE